MKFAEKLMLIPEEKYFRMSEKYKESIKDEVNYNREESEGNEGGNLLTEMDTDTKKSDVCDLSIQPPVEEGGIITPLEENETETGNEELEKTSESAPSSVVKDPAASYAIRDEKKYTNISDNSQQTDTCREKIVNPPNFEGYMTSDIDLFGNKPDKKRERNIFVPMLKKKWLKF